MAESIVLPDVGSSQQTHAVQPWHSEPISGIMSARLQAGWRDQGWGNQKGAILARVSTADGKSLYAWRRIGPYPAPHIEKQMLVELPEEFFSGQVPNPDLCLHCMETAYERQEIKIPEDLMSHIASAKFGCGDSFSDVTDIVKSELAAGKTVRACPWQEAIALFGDPCPGKGKELLVTLAADAAYEHFLPMPNDACLELGFEVGGGGGHSLHIRHAQLLVEKTAKVFTATVKAPEVVITTMAGEEFARFTVAEEDAEETCADRIREAVGEILGAGQGFRVVIADTGAVIRG